jgi:hypothetical protein
MKEIITKYLDANYRLSVASLKDYKLYNIRENKSETMIGVYKNLGVIFGIATEELADIFQPWVEKKAIELNNRITDIQFKIYKATGVEIKLTAEQLADLIENESYGYLISHPVE